MPTRRGRKSAAQTPAPKSDRIYGSKTNPKGSASSRKSAKSITLSDKTIVSLKEKLAEFKKSHKKDITLNDLKAVYRRGLGAYSSSHRPTITGGVPNSRNAWAMARVNKFLLKAGGAKVKAAYVQDDDLMAKGGKVWNDKELLKKYNSGESIGFTGIAHLKAQGLIKRADGTKRKSYEDGGKTQETIFLWHGGDLNDYDEIIAQKSGRYEYGAGLYLTTELSVALKYSKGSRKLYLVEVEKGNEISDSELPLEEVERFINNYILKSKRSEVKDRIKKFTSDGLVKANIFNNIILNEKAIQSTKTYHLRDFYVKNGIDYEIVDNAYGWGEEMLVLYNMNKIKSKKMVKQSDAYDIDLKNTNIRFGKGGKTGKKKTGGGDCYVAAGDIVLNQLQRERFKFLATGDEIQFIGTPYLIHAEVRGQGAVEGLRYGHAWIEDDVLVYDYSNGRQLVLPKELYYSIGDIQTDNPKKYQKYTFEEAKDKLLSTGNYGCWDLEVDYAEGGSILTDDQKDLYDMYKLNKLQQMGEGGMNEHITCKHCGWEWDTKDSDEEDKYVCHKCGFDNTLYYIDIMSTLKQPKTLEEIAEIHGITDVQGAEMLSKQLEKGIKTEMEHTSDERVAKTIALHHIEEMPDYYDKLEEMEKGEQIVKVIAKHDTPIEMETTDKLKEGGVVVGKRHSESDENGTGERFLVKSTGQVVELEGGEGVLNKKSMDSSRQFDFNGEKKTAREIASFLNHKYGGVEFADGGKVKDNKVCGCKFYHGGELPSATLDSLEGGEAVVTVKTMESKDKYNFKGKEMTPRQILSSINYEFGGKRFEDGGVIDLSKHKFGNEVKMTKMVYFVENILY